MMEYVGKYFKHEDYDNHTAYYYVVQPNIEGSDLYQIVFIALHSIDGNIVYAKVEKAVAFMCNLTLVEITQAEFESAQSDAIAYLDGLRGKVKND